VTVTWAVELKRLRAALGLSQEHLAHLVGVTLSSVNRWEKNHITPSKLSVRALRALAERKGVAFAGS